MPWTNPWDLHFFGGSNHPIQKIAVPSLCGRLQNVSWVETPLNPCCHSTSILTLLCAVFKQEEAPAIATPQRCPPVSWEKKHTYVATKHVFPLQTRPIPTAEGPPTLSKTLRNRKPALELVFDGWEWLKGGCQSWEHTKKHTCGGWRSVQGLKRGRKVEGRKSNVSVWKAGERDGNGIKRSTKERGESWRVWMWWERTL